MSQSVVLFADTKVDQNRNLFDKLEELFEKTIGPTISEGERICLKTHFGKFGNMADMRPAIIRKMVDLLKAKGAIIALGETCGIGFSREGPFGGRTSATDYYENAAMNGYSIGTMNAPLILLDGELGADTYDYDIKDGELLKTAAVARGLIGFDRTIVFSHAKGHHGTGLAGAIKNLGIGMVGKYGKASCHTDVDTPLSIDQEKCLGEACSECLRKCPKLCMTFEGNKLRIDASKCIHCFHCESICHRKVGQKAISGQFEEGTETFVKKVAESAAGVVRLCEEIHNELFFFNILLDISPVCDCSNHTPRYMTPDIGIVASKDPVAVDQAAIDLINAEPPMPGSLVTDLKPGEDKFAALFGKTDDKGEFKPMISHHIQIQHAEKMGLGSSNYKLAELEN